ncbi:MAG TPA: hypothetical protein VIU93_11255 [Gallionellaceae bacterium]
MKPADEKRSRTSLIRWTEEEFEQVKVAAGIRHLTMSEFIRRTALGRKADVQIEVDIILALSRVVQEIRSLHREMVERGLAPPEKELLEVMQSAGAAILTIDKCY